MIRFCEGVLSSQSTLLKTAGHRLPKTLDLSILKPNPDFSPKHHWWDQFILHWDLSRNKESRVFVFLKDSLLSGFHASLNLDARVRMGLDTIILWGWWGLLWGLGCVCRVGDGACFPLIQFSFWLGIVLDHHHWVSAWRKNLMVILVFKRITLCHIVIYPLEASFPQWWWWGNLYLCEGME